MKPSLKKNAAHRAPRAVNARDVAKVLGIAVSTVGRAVADDPRISERTKLKVRQVASKLGYVGNAAARIMRGGSSKLIGLMIPDVANDFYASIAQSLSACADARGYRLVLLLTHDDRQVEARQVREMASAQAAGLIIVPTHNPTPEMRQILKGLPSVQFLRRVPSLGSDWFGIDDKEGMAAATSHLLAHGHRRIAYVGGKKHFSTGAQRVRGYQLAIGRHDGEKNADLELLGDPTVEFGELAMERLLKLANRPTAVVSGSVHITAGMIRVIERVGLAVPDQLSIVGFGEAPWYEWWRGGITTLKPSVTNLARSCGIWFMDKLETKAALAQSGYAVTSTCELVVRKTVKARR